MDYDVVIGLDVGKHVHHACGLDPAGVRVLDREVDNTETALREVFGQAVGHGRVLVVVDQLHSIGALPVTVAQSMGIDAAYLPGLSMRRLADLHPGNAKTDARDAYVIANAALSVPHTLQRLDIPSDAQADLAMLLGYDDDLAGQVTSAINRLRGLLVQIHPSLEKALGDNISHEAVLRLLIKTGGPDGMRKLGQTRIDRELNRATAHFDRRSLQLLASVIGTSWRFATGAPLAQRPGSLIAVGQTFVATDACQLDIRSELDVLRFEGFDEDYPRLRVGSAERSALEGARRSGRLTFRGRGETVEHVYLVREEIISLRNEEVQWVYSSDIALVFELSRGYVGIAKAGHHDEVMFVSFGASVEELDLPDRTIEWDWDNEIGQEYRTSREFIDILDCLEGSGGGAPRGGQTP